jgi:two-component system, LytTR family, response regulator
MFNVKRDFMSTIKAIIVEDEQPAREIVKSYLKSFPEIEIIGEYADGFSGLKAINELKPDLLFLDIQLPKLTGFELLDLVEHWPVVIFATAYDQFAIKAFEMNATDYLLKPFSADRFATALQKAKEKIAAKTDKKIEAEKIVQSIDEQNEILDRVVVKTGAKIKVIPSETISYIEAQDDYVMIYCTDGKFLKEKTMKYFESHLDPKNFSRIHRSYIANINNIVRLEPFEKDNYVAVLKDNSKLKVSDSGYKKLKSVLKF